MNSPHLKNSYWMADLFQDGCSYLHLFFDPHWRSLTNPKSSTSNGLSWIWFSIRNHAPHWPYYLWLTNVELYPANGFLLWNPLPVALWRAQLNPLAGFSSCCCLSWPLVAANPEQALWLRACSNTVPLVAGPYLLPFSCCRNPELGPFVGPSSRTRNKLLTLPLPGCVRTSGAHNPLLV